MSTTCSAVLVTRPWCRRRACLCEKRWVWLFLTRARWICAAERRKRVVNVNRTDEVMMQQVDCCRGNKVQWSKKEAEKRLLYRFIVYISGSWWSYIKVRLRAACGISKLHFSLIFSLFLVIYFYPEMELRLQKRYKTLKQLLIWTKLATCYMSLSYLHPPTSSCHVRLPPSIHPVIMIATLWWRKV